MRYVIVIVSIALFIIWDGLYNRGMYLDQFIWWLRGVLRMIGL